MILEAKAEAEAEDNNNVCNVCCVNCGKKISAGEREGGVCLKCGVDFRVFFLKTGNKIGFLLDKAISCIKEVSI